MVNVDRSVKVMLGMIVLLLGVMALRSVVSVATEAQASTVNDSGQAVIESYKTRLVSSIPLARADEDPVEQIVVMDDAHGFIVQYKYRLEIYHLDDMTLRDSK